MVNSLFLSSERKIQGLLLLVGTSCHSVPFFEIYLLHFLSEMFKASSLRCSP